MMQSHAHVRQTRGVRHVTPADDTTQTMSATDVYPHSFLAIMPSRCATRNLASRRRVRPSLVSFCIAT